MSAIYMTSAELIEDLKKLRSSLSSELLSLPECKDIDEDYKVERLHLSVSRIKDLVARAEALGTELEQLCVEIRGFA